MNVLTRRALLAAFGAVGMIGLAGCPADNETEAKKADAALGGKAEEPKVKDEVLPPPKTQQEAFEALAAVAGEAEGRRRRDPQEVSIRFEFPSRAVAARRIGP